jgi:choline dehydrogenase-like flavoprotein
MQAADADNTTANNQKIQFITVPSKSADIPQVEIFLFDGYSGARGYPTDNATAAYNYGFFALYAALQHLLSHGSGHITSTDNSIEPAIDPNYLSSTYDLHAITTAAKYLRQIVQTPPIDS